MAKLKKVPLQVTLTNGRFVPVSSYDAERLEDYAQNTVFEVKPTKSRSNAHHNKYWAILRRVVKATGKWPTEYHLHDELKLACGYVTSYFSALDGSFIRLPDSISFAEMNQTEFNKYFEAAMAKLAEGTGIDPLELDG